MGSKTLTWSIVWIPTILEDFEDFEDLGNIWWNSRETKTDQ